MKIRTQEDVTDKSIESAIMADNKKIQYLRLLKILCVYKIEDGKFVYLVHADVGCLVGRYVSVQDNRIYGFYLREAKKGIPAVFVKVHENWQWPFPRTVEWYKRYVIPEKIIPKIRKDFS